VAALAHVHMVDPTREEIDYALLLQTARVAPERMPGWKRNVALSVQPWMWETFGAHLLAAGSALTGSPGVVTQLWMVGVDYSPSGAAAKLRGRRWHQAFLEDVDDLREEVLLPMGYDPPRNVAPGREPARSTPGGRHDAASTMRSFLIDHIDVPSRRLGDFSRGKREVFLPLVTARAFGWRLVASGARVSDRMFRGGGFDVASDGSSLRATCPATTVVNLWDLPAPDALPRVMLHLSENQSYQSFRDATVGGEDQHLLLPVGSYDPRPVWSQSDAAAPQDISQGRWHYR
jgi:hypothetical protein